LLRFDVALQDQPAQAILSILPVKILAVVLFLGGNTLVVTSMWKLGVTGTYLG